MQRNTEELNEMMDRILRHLDCIDEVIESLIKRIGTIEYYINATKSKYNE